MNVECPHCSESDQTVGVPHALSDAAHPLGPVEHGALLPPPAPAPPKVAHSKVANVLYTVAGLVGAMMVMNLGNGLPDPEETTAAYRAGYVFGPLILAVPLALAGLAVQLATKQRRAEAVRESAQVQHALWGRRHWVWQAVWLCRRCRVCFVPEGALGPGSAASPAIAVAQLPMWVTATADRAPGVPGVSATR
ncbi:hypothetical protein ACGFX4_36235 [Kitasatospora sp. NPDC048365]|uniref:hypothetical protein n=1 Tax=Kitasatospora sp. NPDC048365 TaxID=3364050 RepID=UPI00371326E3